MIWYSSNNLADPIMVEGSIGYKAEQRRLTLSCLYAFAYQPYYLESLSKYK